MPEVVRVGMHDGTGVLRGDSTERASSLCLSSGMGRYSKKTAICKPGSGPSWVCWHLDLQNYMRYMCVV